jgi:hypothetical protein
VGGARKTPRKLLPAKKTLTATVAANRSGCFLAGLLQIVSNPVHLFRHGNKSQNLKRRYLPEFRTCRSE